MHLSTTYHIKILILYITVYSPNSMLVLESLRRILAAGLLGVGLAFPDGDSVQTCPCVPWESEKSSSLINLFSVSVSGGTKWGVMISKSLLEGKPYKIV